MRHRLLAIPLMLLASLVLTTGALAGGWAQVTVTDPPSDPPVGSGTTIELEVLQHAKTPVSFPAITVVATNDSTGEVVRSPASAEGPIGHYVATITFPTEGTWTLTFESPDLIMEGTGDLSVAAVAAAPVAPAASAVSIDPAVGIAALALLALGIGLVVVGLRGRRDQPTTVSG